MPFSAPAIDLLACFVVHLALINPEGEKTPFVSLEAGSGAQGREEHFARRLDSAAEDAFGKGVKWADIKVAYRFQDDDGTEIAVKVTQESLITTIQRQAQRQVDAPGSTPQLQPLGAWQHGTRLGWYAAFHAEYTPLKPVQSPGSRGGKGSVRVRARQTNPVSADKLAHSAIAEFAYVASPRLTGHMAVVIEVRAASVHAALPL